ncbi:polysialyltransferase family glycosyltransferase [Vibrio splendidus]|uniref:polysialyltransferase family glycosyltransferase n=1 Tax=Vibrio splendidus TaxID=29497 RepID=UPI000E3263B9|nr:polysialyltransferase family glycosyltransferase [Vibrio splendidus]
MPNNKMNIGFFVLSQLQFIEAIAISKRLGVETPYLLIDSRLEIFDNSLSYRGCRVDFGHLSESKTHKLKLMFQWLKFCVKENVVLDKLFIPSDVNPFISMFVFFKNLKNKIVYFEEGGTLFYVNSYNKPSLIRKIYFHITINNYKASFLQSERLNEGYVFLKESVEKVRGNISFHDLSEILDSEMPNIDYSLSEKALELHNEPDLVFLTQPLTLDKICKDDFEVEVLKRFILASSYDKVCIKLHPRDSKERYVDLLDQCPSAFILDENLNNIPYQLLHLSLKPKAIATYFSSVVYSVAPTHSTFRRYMLVNELGNESIKRTAEDYKNMVVDLEIL